MITLFKQRKLIARYPWLMEALQIAHHGGDERTLGKRMKHSVAFIACRPFEKAKPSWKGQSEFHPFFHGSRMAGSDGANYQSYPVVIFHYVGVAGYQFSQLIAGCPTTIAESMDWYIKAAERDGRKIVFDAILRPLVAKINPHHMFAECFEIFPFPKDFEFKNWTKDFELEDWYREAPKNRGLFYFLSCN